MTKLIYAYRDKYGILHATKDQKTAGDYAKGEIVAGSWACAKGYLTVGGEGIFSYANGEIYWAGNKNSDKAVPYQNLSSGIKIEVDRVLREVGI